MPVLAAGLSDLLALGVDGGDILTVTV